MRQVNQDELIHVLVYALGEVSPQLLRQLADGRQPVKASGRYATAGIIANKLARWEILSTAPEPPLFRRAGTGTGAPMIQGED